MFDLILLIFSGALVGFAIGLTGVGGGSLMTPILLLMGYPPPVAIGTDLLYAAVTKSSGVIFHHRKSNVNWKVMLMLAAGSIPVSIGLTLMVMRNGISDSEQYESLLTSFLGVMLIITALVIAFQKHIQRRISPVDDNTESHMDEYELEPAFTRFSHKHTALMTFILGLVLGFCVTMASVGAGAIGAAILFLLYPHWKATTVVGTGIAHAVPLTLVAGLGYLANDLVDMKLLGSLLIGSLPGIYLGTHVGSLFPDKIMRGILITALLFLGLYFSVIH